MNKDGARAPFVFYDSADAFGDGMIANVRAGIASVDELYDVLSEALHLPDYFGRNWNALDEVLGDLSWVAPRRVAFVHADLPQASTIGSRAGSTMGGPLTKTRCWVGKP